MSERSREKIALIVFAVLVAFAGCCLVGYIVAGHSWNVAASTIDDTFGSMEGYTAVVYAGTVKPEPAATAADKKPGASVSADASTATGTPTTLNTSTSAEDSVSASTEGLATASTEDSATASMEDSTSTSAAAPSATSADPDEAAASPSTTSTSTTSDTVSPSASPTSVTDGAASPSESSSAKTLPPASANPTLASPVAAVDVSDVQASYEEKSATVLTLDTLHLEKYSEGTILKKGNLRFGVFSVERSAMRTACARQVEYFKEHDVDFIVFLTSDKAYLEGVEGIDIVISTRDEGLFVMGETKAGTFYVDTPEVGKVGAILISPSNVVSAKEIDEL